MRYGGRGGGNCFGFRESNKRSKPLPQHTHLLTLGLLSFHVTMSGSTLILGVSSVPLIQNPIANAVKHPEADESPTDSDPDLTSIIYSAKWAVAVSLSITVTCQTGIALLNRSLDRKGSLKVSNRYVRLLPRVILVAVVLCLPIDREMRANFFMVIVVCLLLMCLYWEWVVSLERDGGVFEP